MRFTVVDPKGTVSFILDGDALPALLIACSRDPLDLDALLTEADAYYANLREHVHNGLAVFDEHNSRANPGVIHEAFRFLPAHEQPVFRVVDDWTREESLHPVKGGVVIFNLIARRIVQLQNTYSAMQRRGRGRVFDGGRLTDRTFVYRLPQQWTVVP